MEKKLTNSGPLREPADKHSIYAMDNNPLLGHYRVKMALDSLDYGYGHTTVWQMVALYKQAHPHPPREPRAPNPAELPKATTAPHQAWFVDLRHLVQIAGQWLYTNLK